MQRKHIYCFTKLIVASFHNEIDSPIAKVCQISLKEFLIIIGLEIELLK